MRGAAWRRSRTVVVGGGAREWASIPGVPGRGLTLRQAAAREPQVAPRSGGVYGLEQDVDLADRLAHALLHAPPDHLLHLLGIDELRQNRHPGS